MVLKIIEYLYKNKAMELLKKIIREELERVLNALSETDFYSSINLSAKPKYNPKENIVYNYEKGEAFAGDNLEVDLTNLNRYHLTEYLPKSSSEERWSFEFTTTVGKILMVDIIRKIINNKSYWSMKFGQLYRGETIPTLSDTIENIEGYDSFIAAANKKMGPEIDPSKH